MRYRESCPPPFPPCALLAPGDAQNKTGIEHFNLFLDARDQLSARNCFDFAGGLAAQQKRRRNRLSSNVWSFPNTGEYRWCDLRGKSNIFVQEGESGGLLRITTRHTSSSLTIEHAVQVVTDDRATSYSRNIEIAIKQHSTCVLHWLMGPTILPSVRSSSPPVLRIITCGCFSLSYFQSPLHGAALHWSDVQ